MNGKRNVFAIAMTAKRNFRHYFQVLAIVLIVHRPTHSERRFSFFESHGGITSDVSTLCAHKCLASDSCRYVAVGNGNTCMLSSKRPKNEVGGLSKTGYYTSCIDAKTDGVLDNSVVMITIPETLTTINGFCDMETTGSGWLVFQRRVNGKESFDRGWKDYVDGFGNVAEDFWLGLENIYLLTSNARMKLRIDIENIDGDVGYAEYDDFTVSGSHDGYRLSVSGYSGDIGDALGDKSHPQKNSNGQKFSTKDNDNDKSAVVNCAFSKMGGWWFNKCYLAHLNGVFGINIDVDKHISWKTWKDRVGDIELVEMKMQPA